VKAGLRLLEENYTEAGVDCYFIRARLLRTGLPLPPADEPRKSAGGAQD